MRVPDHAVAQALLQELGEPILSSTLILPGSSEPLNDAEAIRDVLGARLDLVIDAGRLHRGADDRRRSRRSSRRSSCASARATRRGSGSTRFEIAVTDGRAAPGRTRVK